MMSGCSQYDLLLPRRVVFGWGRRNELGPLAAELGRRAFLVTGSRTLQASGTVEAVTAQLREAGVETVPIGQIAHEPEVQDVDATVARILEHRPGEGDLVIGLGGGSAIDLAKAVAALVTNRHGESVRDFLEGVGNGLTIDQPTLPFLAVPTTAGTGSEATKNAVISSYDPTFKKSLRSPRMVAAAVLIDPELTVTVPASVTAATGMDAITQLIESYISGRTQPFTRALCLEGLQRALPAIVTAVEQPTDRPAREAMSHAAFLSGMALANSGLGLAHGVAAALGVHCRTPHGIACAVMLPAALRVNRDVRRDDLAHLGRLLTDTDSNDPDVLADAFIEHIESICSRVGIPRTLSQLGVEREQIAAIVPSSHGNSMRGNPTQLTDDELTSLLEGML
ncbi:Alcohol dehydrogenase 2 [Maioricimonas rarisocia]|uniref:Alcohol dehydrogenase 2 n=1 Tax=Maioricimonas rarisocia TaxID=2528026 RepID=A0A517Z483_9PLAN|nr:iron-containing alcohol dehydrogenase [Maioricimonas rarisocia]QDU37298.1 Alcohol dehydrogenase 2 [Maioricimonas rarisocia]